MSASEVQPHPVFAQRISEVAEKLEKVGQRALAADLYDIAAALTPRGEELRQRAAALRRGVGGEDSEREHKRHNLEASHAVGMARVFEVRGELGRAQEMFDLGKLRAPFHYLAYAGAGYLHLRRRDLRAALEEFVQARRLNPLDRKLAIEAARVALELEEYQEALRHAADALLLSQGLGEAEEAAARRRVDTLGALCKFTREDLAELHRQRAAALQRACEQVALTRARLFSTLALADSRTPRRVAPSAVRDDLLKVALELRRFRALRHLSDPQLLELAQTGKRETFRHAQILTREGQDERDVLILVEGKLHACRRTPLGTQVLSALAVGDIAGEISFLDRKPRSTTLVGVDGGAVLRLAARDLEQLATRSEDLGVALLWAFWHSLSAKVRAANAAMTEIITPGAVPRRTSSGQPGERVTVDPAVKLDILREQGLSASELRLLASYSREERFPAETLIFAEGEPGDTLYIVVDGQVRISRRLAGMGEEALTILGRGEVFGEMSLIDEQARSADARAHIDGCTVFTVDRQRLQEVLEMDPDAARQFLTLLCTILCRRIRAMNDRLVAWRVMAGHE